MEVDGRPCLASPQNTLKWIIGDDFEGSLCRLKLSKAGATGNILTEVSIRRARCLIVQVCV